VQGARRHRVGPAAFAATGSRRHQPRDRSLAAQLELGARSKVAEHRPSAGGRGVRSGSIEPLPQSDDLVLLQMALC
jgi:hypothetical protein